MGQIGLFENYSYFIGWCAPKKTLNNYTKNVNINIQRMQFPNLWAQNNPRQVDMLLKINQSSQLLKNANQSSEDGG